MATRQAISAVAAEISPLPKISSEACSSGRSFALTQVTGGRMKLASIVVAATLTVGRSHRATARRSGRRWPSDHTAATGALFKAIRASDMASVKSALAAGANVNGRSDEGDTPLMYAAVYSTADCVKTLLEHGADPNERDTARRDGPDACREGYRQGTPARRARRRGRCPLGTRRHCAHDRGEPTGRFGRGEVAAGEQGRSENSRRLPEFPP